MSKAVKLKNSLYLASTSIVHKRGRGWHYLSDLLDNIYPVGSIHITTNNVNPSTYFGGTWQKLSGGYLYATASTIEKTSYTGWGTQSHTLTTNQIPAHGHRLRYGSMTSDNSGRLMVSYTGGSYRTLELSAWNWVNSDTNGNIFAENTGGGQGHTHNIATVDVFVWKRTA